MRGRSTKGPLKAKHVKEVILTAALIALSLAPAPVLAFGTVRVLHQNAEHERITRQALACDGLANGANCLERKTLKELAGADNNFGAIGIPDRGELVPNNRAHCDGGDYLDIPGYPHSEIAAESALESCRAFMVGKLEEAVDDARKLLDAEGRLRSGQLSMPCMFVGQIKGHAKCNVIEDLGVLMHASQDFYSHTNWVDVADTTRAIDAENPPGLGKTGRASWLDLRQSQTFPDGLISGCSEGHPEKSYCNYGPGKVLHRIKHSVLTKDSDTTLRGRHDNNFARAFDAAIDDTRDKWLTFTEKLVAAYGSTKGTLMACAISHDDPVRDCGR